MMMDLCNVPVRGLRMTMAVATISLLTGCPSGSRTTGITDPVAHGRLLYQQRCATCHGEDGNGVQGKYPPLNGSSRVLGSQTRLAAIVLDGMSGEVVVKGARYNFVMPASRGVLKEQEIAHLLTYLRQAWDNRASPQSVKTVHAVSRQYQSRNRFWTASELEVLVDEKSEVPSDF